MIPMDKEAMSAARWTNLSLLVCLPFDSWANAMCAEHYKEAGGEI